MGTVSLLTPVGKDVFLFKWQPSFLWSDACKKASKCNSPHTRLSLNLTSTCWSIFSKFSPCDLQVKDQGGYLHPAHPCVNHPHLKMKVTNKLQPLFILCCLSHLFHVNLAVSHYSYIMPPPFFFFVYPRLSFFVFLLLSFWACKVLNASALFFPPSADFEREDISGLFKALHGHKTNTNSLLPGDVQDARGSKYNSAVSWSPTVLSLRRMQTSLLQQAQRPARTEAGSCWSSLHGPPTWLPHCSAPLPVLVGRGWTWWGWTSYLLLVSPFSHSNPLTKDLCEQEKEKACWCVGRDKAEFDPQWGNSSVVWHPQDLQFQHFEMLNEKGVFRRPLCTIVTAHRHEAFYTCWK